MGKRGPKADDEFGDQKAVLSTRITPGTREALEQAAAASGRPLSREVEHRLRRSFDTDAIVDTLGGPQLYAMLRLISATMMAAGTGWVSSLTDKSRQSVDWLSDPDGYEQAVRATNAVLEALRPAGEISPPVTPSDDSELSRVAALLTNDRGGALARGFLREVGSVEPVQPSPAEKLSEIDKLQRRIASGLGPAHDRLKE